MHIAIRLPEQTASNYVPAVQRRVNQKAFEEISESWRQRGAQIGKNVRILGQLDQVNPHLISIGDNSVVGGHSALLAHGPTKEGARCTLGKNVYVGFGAIVLQGVSVGDNSIVGAGAVVAQDVPPNSIVAGNPARIVRQRDPQELASYIQAMQEGRYIGAVMPDGKNRRVDE